MRRLCCPICAAYLLDHPMFYDLRFKDWKKCPTCGYCELQGNPQTGYNPDSNPKMGYSQKALEKALEHTDHLPDWWFGEEKKHI